VSSSQNQPVGYALALFFLRLQSVNAPIATGGLWSCGHLTPSLKEAAYLVHYLIDAQKSHDASHEA
jgi:hypothetical protein